MLNRTFALTTCAAALVLAGCATTVNQTSAPGASTASAPASLQIPAASGAIAVVLVASAEMKKSGDWKSFTDEWQSALPEAAKELKTSSSLAENEAAIAPGSARLIRVKVNDFRYISTAKRFMLGIMAGNAFMDLDVEYVQLPSMQVLGSKKINTSSSAWEGIFSGVTPRQVAAVSMVVLKDAQGSGSAAK
jgi:hypothetical protein